MCHVTIKMALQKLHDTFGQDVSLSNSEALPFFNEGVLLLVSSNGVPFSCLEKAIAKDEDFLLAQLVAGCIVASSALAAGRPDCIKNTHVLAVKKLLLNKEKIASYTPREQLYAKAFAECLKGNLPQFGEIMWDILVDYPKDAIALRFLVSVSITTGKYERLRDAAARVLPFWEETSPTYPYIIAFYSFGLEETNYRVEAAELAYKSLSLQPCSPWATHTICHVVEESRDAEEGVELLERTRKDWKNSILGNHISWHLALHYLDTGSTDKVLEEFDSVIRQNVATAAQNPTYLVDACSLLWRLEMMGVDPGGERWAAVEEACKGLLDVRGWAFLDLHLMLAFSHGRPTECAARAVVAEQIVKSMQEYSEVAKENYLGGVTGKLGVPVCQALVAYSREQYDEVLSLLLPLRYSLVDIGGSWAQRQVVALTAIQAAIKGKQHTTALALIAELKALKPKNRQLPKLFEQVRQEVDNSQ